AYLNTPEFRDGGQVNETPVFIANLYDKSGINTIGTGIGHDMVVKLDNDPLKEWSLNYYYESIIGSYQEGNVSYKFSELSEGKHTLTFRAWDLQNNSSSISLNFEVVKGLHPTLYDMYAYPNPAVSQVYFVYEHDRPDSPLDIQASVFDLSGRLIWKSDKVAITSTGKTEVEWDLWSEGGGMVRPGIYLVRMEVSVSNSEKINKTIKLMIKGQ
ncbi:MAG: T9SS type A sorting domain-containing protein, partial [Sphingobacteriia bacterium]|nr:T9SS type A sorting domain-containing protein [Sphingobacteriia bacterium]